MSQHPHIRLLITGGTIDKCYNELTGELYFSQSHLPQMLKQGHCNTNIVLETLMLKDSLEMKTADRDVILQACQQSHQSSRSVLKIRNRKNGAPIKAVKTPSFNSTLPESSRTAISASKIRLAPPRPLTSTRRPG